MSTPGERRHAAILFADLSGFTRLAERMDPEDVRDLVDGLFRRFRSLIESHGGIVDKFIGDAVMAVFGAPVARGDDVARAVRAGLALQADLDSFNREKSIDLAMRVGINAGEILWGSVGGGAPTAMGDPVNVAQRLETAAEPGSVLVSAAVERGARGAFRFRAAGSVALKGRDETVDTFEAEDAPADLTEVRAAPPSPFAGREEERARLREAWRAGKGGAFVLVGEAGVGKSRLAAEPRREARESGGWAALGRAREGAAVPLAPFAEILRAEAGATADGEAVARHVAKQLEGSDCDVVSRENCAQLVALSAGFALPGARVAAIEPARLAAEERSAWAAWLGARAPALLCVEDLHWADPAAIALLEHLAAALRGRPVLLLATARPGATLPSGFEPVPLSPLSGPAAAAVARAALGADPSPELAAWLAEKSGGNPFYLEELARFLRDGAQLEGAPLRLKAGPARLPEGLQNLLTARLDALAPATKETLKAASVLGRSFWKGVLDGMLGADAEGALADARKHGLVATRGASLLPGDTEYAFRHALLRDAAASLLPKKEKARLHARAAELLEPLAATAGRTALALAAEHREGASQPAEAAALWRAAALRGILEAHWDEGLSHARRAERVATSPAGRLLVGRALRKLGHYEESLAILRDIDGTPAERVEALVSSSQSRLAQGALADALSLADAALAVEVEPLWRADSLTARGAALNSLGHRAEGLPSLDEAVALARGALAGPYAARAGRVLAWALQIQTSLLWHLGRHAEGRATIEEAVALRRRLDDRAGLASALASYGALQQMRGETEAARALHDEVLATRRSIGDRAGLSYSLCMLADLENGLPRFPEALAAGREALALSQALGDRMGQGRALSRLSEIHLARGALSEAEADARAALEKHRESGNRHGESMTLGTLGEILFARGRAAEALPLRRQSVELDRQIGHAWNEIESTCALAGTLLEAGLATEAIPLWEEVARRAIASGMASTAADALLSLALYARPEEAEARVREAAAHSQGRGIAFLEVTAGLVHARLGRPEAAATSLAAARAAFVRGRRFITDLAFAELEARLLLTLGRADEAREIASRHLARAREAGAERWVVSLEKLGAK